MGSCGAIGPLLRVCYHFACRLRAGHTQGRPSLQDSTLWQLKLDGGWRVCWGMSLFTWKLDDVHQSQRSSMPDLGFDPRIEEGFTAAAGVGAGASLGLCHGGTRSVSAAGWCLGAISQFSEAPLADTPAHDVAGFNHRYPTHDL